MDAITSLTFGDPRWLLAALAAIPLTWWLVVRERTRRRLAARFVSERLRGEASAARSLRPFLIGVSIAAAATALASPQLGSETRLVDVSTHNRVFAIDVSNSMLVRDVGVSRLDAAKSLLARIVGVSGGRVGLVAFEKRAEVIAPLTSDVEAVVTLLETLGTGETAEGGSDIGEGVRTAIIAAEGPDARASDVVVVSDGEDQGSSIDVAINEARRRGVRVHAIMIGTVQGERIVTDGGVLRDGDGLEIVSRASATDLRRLASETGGEFFTNPYSASALERLEERLRRRGAASSDQQEVRIPLERFQWPLSLALIAALLASFLQRGAA